MTDRLFFALWPTDVLRAELAARLPPLLAGSDGRAQRPDQWHVTLEFLGDVAAERLPLVRAAAGEVTADPFDVTFDSVALWRRAQVLCLEASATPAPLSSLLLQLRAALAARGFDPERRPFRPHVTLARKVASASPGPLTHAIVWPAESFALVKSVTGPAGSRYEPLDWWNLLGRRD